MVKVQETRVTRPLGWLCEGLERGEEKLTRTTSQKVGRGAVGTGNDPEPRARVEGAEGRGKAVLYQQRQ